MAVDIVSEHLCLVAIKDSLLLPKGADGKRRSEFRPVGQGVVEWNEVIGALLAANYTGAISLHSEYEAPTTEARLEMTKKDLAYLRDLEKTARAAASV